MNPRAVQLEELVEVIEDVLYKYGLCDADFGGPTAYDVALDLAREILKRVDSGPGKATDPAP